MRKGKADRYKNTSKFISLILRHKPETIGITLDEHGWADVEELIEGINRTGGHFPDKQGRADERKLIEGINRTGGHFLDMKVLEEIVASDEKQRYSFNEDHTLIRANQGHSIPVDVELEKKTPPDVLWHGTGEKFVDSINAQGLIPKSRLYVHLSSDIETAKKVGSRHGRPVICEIDCKRMAQDGYLFFESVNHVWLTKKVPVQYLNWID